MIQPNDLRIGNWMETKGDYFKVAKVVSYLGKPQIYKTNFVGSWSNNVYHQKGFDKINPIPLTDEILKIAGLKERYVKGEWSWSMNGKWSSYTEIVKKEEGYKFLDSYPLIKYVHQLQNLYYALTCTELEIDLNADSSTTVSVGKKLKEDEAE